MASYYRSFIENFSELVRPITELTKRNARFVWNEDRQKSFEILKEKLSSAPILAHPKIGEPFKLFTDSSDYAVGAVLTQERDGKDHVIQYISKQLSDGQYKWPIIEKEPYAIVFALNKLRHFLYGSKFTIFTDHKPLRSLFTSEMKNVRVQRWAIMLEEYGCDIQYRTGKSNEQADLLSRIREHDENTGDHDSDHILSTLCDESHISVTMGECENLQKALEHLEKAQTACQQGDEWENSCKVDHIIKDVQTALDSKTSDLKVNYDKDLSQKPFSVSVIDNSQLDPPKFKRKIENDDSSKIENETDSTSDIAFENIGEKQKQDPNIQEILDNLNENSKLNDEFIILDDVLYHISNPVRNDNTQRLQLVIPKCLQNKVLEQFHNDQFGGGHTGHDKTYDKVRR